MVTRLIPENNRPRGRATGTRTQDCEVIDLASRLSTGVNCSLGYKT